MSLRIIGQRPGGLYGRTDYGRDRSLSRPRYYDLPRPSTHPSQYVESAPTRTEAVYEQPKQWRDLVLGLEALAVGAGASVSATQNPQVIFRPQRIVVSAANAPSFTIDDVKVGNKSQLVANGSIPADAFIPNASDGIEMMMDTCQVSQDFILDVTNQSAGALDFRAAVYGKALF